jgi:hypothetical protein
MAASMMEGIIAYESGELDDEEVIELFQQLVNTGTAWKLQGHYGRTAQRLIEQRKIKLPLIGARR